jgi:hypothetical protein
MDGDAWAFAILAAAGWAMSWVNLHFANRCSREKYQLLRAWAESCADCPACGPEQ